MQYVVEFDDQAMRWMDFSSVDYEQGFYLSAERVADLRDYVEGMGYDWNEVAYVYEVRAA